ncbi:hypothetical protein [Caballeronia sp.]|uniref:hypothetical protein n=1 Tax=Caballeronia sp. TaxID=1931223 RepID=UPI003C457734
MAQNDREQKLLEVQATNAQAENAARNNANSTSPSTARPYYGPTNGVFGGPPPARAVPPTTGATAGTVPLLKK